MKSATGFASAVSLILLASCARPPAAKPGTAAPAAVPAAIEGTWREIRNENQPVTGKTWTFAGNRVSIRDHETAYTGTFSTDDTLDPKTIDFAFEGYPANQGIYLLTGALLTLKVRNTAAERAKNFGIENGYTLILCERAKENAGKRPAADGTPPAPGGR